MTNQQQGDLYSVGLATVDITPPVGTTMAGFAARRKHCAVGVYHPLRAVAWVVNDGTTPILFLVAELVSFGDKAGRVRDRIHQVTGIPHEQIVLSCTHTHCGPAMRERDIRTHGRIDTQYIDHAINQMAKAAAIAWENQYEAYLAVGKGRCTMAMSRRMPDPDNPPLVKRSMLPNPDGPTDHDVPVLTMTSPDGVMRGILFSYACHTTSRGGLMIGGDYAGFAYDYLQEQFPFVQPAFLQGCAGDQKPRPVDMASGVFGNRTVEQLRELGSELGQAVADAIADDMTPVQGPIKVNQSVIQLQTEPLDRQMLRAELENPTYPYRQVWAQYFTDLLDRGQPEPLHVPFELQTIELGSTMAMVTMAGEMNVEYSTGIKCSLQDHFKHVWPLGYTNEMVGYVPVARQFKEQGYEVLDANMMHRRTGRYVEQTEAWIMENICRMLDVPSPAREQAQAR